MGSERMKVKITKEFKTLDGEVISKAVTPFGTSAHIPFSRKHTGKLVDVIVPSEARYVWLLSGKELEDVINSCLKIIKSEKETKMTFQKFDHINNLKQKNFELQDLEEAIETLKRGKNKQTIAEKIEKIYGLS